MLEIEGTEEKYTPRVGPAYAATEYNAIAVPRFAGSQKSENEAETNAIGAAPNDPASILQTRIVARLRDRAIGICMMANIKNPLNIGSLLPTSSETGPQNNGPRANPSTKSETPSSIVVSVVSNSREVTTIVDDQIEEQNVVVNVNKANSTVIPHFRPVGHLNGSSYAMFSSGSSRLIFCSVYELSRLFDCSMRLSAIGYNVSSQWHS